MSLFPPKVDHASSSVKILLPWCSSASCFALCHCCPLLVASAVVMHVYETARLQLPWSRQAGACPQCSTCHTALFQHSLMPPRFSPRSRSVCNAEARLGAGSSRQASISTNGSYDVRQATADTGGTAGRRSQVAEQDVLPNGSIRPRVTPTVVRSYQVPLWGAVLFACSCARIGSTSQLPC